MEWAPRAREALAALVAVRHLTEAQRVCVAELAERDAAGSEVFPINVGHGAALVGHEGYARLGLGDDWWPSPSR
jgi:hypothetical protein